MKCPVCGGAELIPDRVQLIPYEWLGHETMLEGHGDLCPMCGEMLLSYEGSDSLEQQMQEFKRKVREEISAPEYISAVRKKLGLSQRQAGELFGGGVNAFSRYELGKINPPLSLVQLFRILDRQPELLEVLRMPPVQTGNTREAKAYEGSQTGNY